MIGEYDMKKIGISLFFAMFIIGFSTFESLGQTRIRFARGRTSTSVTSTISRNSQRKFILAAYAGQDLSATVSSRNGCVVLGNRETSTSFVTDRGDNWIDLFNRCRTPTTFTLTVSIR
jgi:hypothetical protein